MPQTTNTLLQSYLDDAHLGLFAQRLTDWLITDLNKSDTTVPNFTESRAKALLRAANVIDDPTLHSFERLMSNPLAVRVALHELLQETSLAEDDQVKMLAATIGQAAVTHTAVTWLSLAIAAFAWKSGYPLYQLDPASPPEAYSPAGQLVKRAAYFVRQQIQHTATERDKLARQLAYQPGTAVAPTHTLDMMSEQPPAAPIPPHYRPPIPVNYPEVARETIHITPDDAQSDILSIPEPPQVPEVQPPPPVSPPFPPDVTRATPLTITDADLPQPTRMPRIRITEEETKTTTEKIAEGANSFANAVRQKMTRERQGRGPMTTTRLRILVQEYPDGPGMYGLQVKVMCPGIKTHIAGITNRRGSLLCELPVRVQGGLTYNVELTWPRAMNHEVESKSITINADRNEFVLPFYRRLQR